MSLIRQVVQYTGEEPIRFGDNSGSIKNGDRLVLNTPIDLSEPTTAGINLSNSKILRITGVNYEQVLTQHPAQFTVEVPSHHLKEAHILDTLLLPFLAP